MARVSLEHAFAEGASLWSQPEGYGTTVGACTGQALGKSPASPGCERFLGENTRAALLWKLEGQLASFEAGFVK